MKDVWNYLKECKRPILLYGMGNGADKILKYFDRYGIAISGIFASDGFVRGNLFHGFKIESYSEIMKRFDDPVIILGFASHRDDVIDSIYKKAKLNEILAPDVPVCDNSELFNYEFYEKHKQELNEARIMLYDDESKRIFDEVIKYKLSADIEHLLCACSDKNEVYNDILNIKEVKNYADLGAYKGDTVSEVMEFGAPLEYICAFEPDIKSFGKLKDFLKDFKNADLINACAYNEECVLSFGNEGNRGSALNKEMPQTHLRSVPANSVDNVLNGRKVDYIKYDVEGSEKEALIGSAEIIKKYKPKLCISVYHRSEDLYSLIKLVNGFRNDYKFYLRRFKSIPAWDLNLYAV